MKDLTQHSTSPQYSHRKFLIVGPAQSAHEAARRARYQDYTVINCATDLLKYDRATGLILFTHDWATLPEFNEVRKIILDKFRGKYLPRYIRSTQDSL